MNGLTVGSPLEPYEFFCLRLHAVLSDGSASEKTQPGEQYHEVSLMPSPSIPNVFNMCLVIQSISVSVASGLVRHGPSLLIPLISAKIQELLAIQPNQARYYICNHRLVPLILLNNSIYFYFSIIMSMSMSRGSAPMHVSCSPEIDEALTLAPHLQAPLSWHHGTRHMRGNRYVCMGGKNVDSYMHLANS